MERKAIGIVRVSEVAGRSGPEFASPVDQQARIEAACERDGFDLLETISELDVSGGTPLSKRAGLRGAVERIEAGEAEVLIVAYFDRLFRSLAVQGEVTGRVEAAGGAILAVDVGQVTNGSAGQWMTGTMLGAVAEYHRRATGERTHEAIQRALNRGVPPFPGMVPGYTRERVNGKLVGPFVPDPVTAPVVAEAFRLRADGASVEAVREHLRAHGVERSFHGAQALLASRVVIGELHFGKFTPNLDAHPAIVDRALWARVQAVRVPRGRRPVSDRLLARLGVLRCGTCGARMTAGSARPGGKGAKRYPFYRCPTVGDCPRRVTIGADIAEKAVTEAVQAALAGVEGSASIGEGVEAAARALDAAQAELDAAIRAFEAVMDEPAARERLADLRQTRDEAQEHLDRLSAAQAPAMTVTAGDWDRLTLAERRALIQAVVESAAVAPGRGPERVTVELRGE